MKIFTKIATAVFVVIALTHALRLAYAWPAEIGGWAVPMWLSGLTIVLSLALAWGLSKE